jgi:hypothetical protein
MVTSNHVHLFFKDAGWGFIVHSMQLIPDCIFALSGWQGEAYDGD